MTAQERGKDFFYGIIDTIFGNFLVSSIIEYDNNVFVNGSRLAIGFWALMFMVSSIAFFQVTKLILRDFEFQKSTLQKFDFATIVCVLLGIIEIGYAIVH
jgi:hypothetical protein